MQSLLNLHKEEIDSSKKEVDDLKQLQRSVEEANARKANKEVAEKQNEV